MMHIEKFNNLKPGEVLHKELVSFVCHSNQFEPVIEDTWWWSQVVTSKDHHRRLRSVYSQNYSGSQLKEVKFDVDHLCYVRMDSAGTGNITEDDALEICKAAGVTAEDEGRQLIQTFMVSNSGD